MTIEPPNNSRRGFAYAALIVGAMATLLLIGAILLGRALESEGLSSGLIVVLFYYSAPFVGMAAIIIGVIGIITSRSKMLSLIGVMLGALPIILIVLQMISGYQIPEV